MQQKRKTAACLSELESGTVWLFQTYAGSPRNRQIRGVKQQESRTCKTRNGCKVASRENPFSRAAAAKGHPLRCPMALPEFALVLADSTAYGWLEGSTFGGTELVHREAVAGAEQRSALVAAVVCGGSLIKKGLAGPCAVDVLMKDWVLQGGATAFAGEQELEVGVVPAASSVPGREYEGLKTARSGFGVEETNTTILAAVGNAYGAKARPLHFVRAEAARAMDAIVRATTQDLVARRVARQQLAITAEPRSAGAEQRSAQWLPVIICAGWNCGEKEVLAEAYVAAKLSKCLQWRDFVQGLSAHATCRLPWQEIAPHLTLAPARLVQTNSEDHTSAKENMTEFAAFLVRSFADDAVCRNDICQLGGSVLLQKYLGIARASHRADMWRYIHLFKHGGFYLDIKMCLLRPLEETLADIYRQGNALVAQTRQRSAQPSEAKAAAHPTAAGQRSAQPAVLDAPLEKQPHLVMSRGANQRHVYQGNILACSAGHPLLARAICDCLQTTQAQLGAKYLRFCEYLWREMEIDLGAVPQIGWNFCPTLGPIYLLEERLVKAQGKKVQRMKTSSGQDVPMDGHCMFLAQSDTAYAATRAWGWNHGFVEVKLAAFAVERAAAAEQQRHAVAESGAQSSAQRAVAAQSGSQEATVMQSSAQLAVGEDAVTGETPAAELTEDILQQCLQLAAACSHYQDLAEAEVATLVSLGLRPATTGQGYLTCQHCKNRKRTEKKFQGTDQVREHFEQNHGEGDATGDAAVTEEEAKVATETVRQGKMWGGKEKTLRWKGHVVYGISFRR